MKGGHDPRWRHGPPWRRGASSADEATDEGAWRWPHGPPWHAAHGGRGPQGAWQRRGPWRGRGASLRRRLTVAFALVALGAVALTTWSTFQGVARLQSTISGSPESTVTQPGDGGERLPGVVDGELAKAFAQVRRTAVRAGALSFVMAVLAAGAFTNVLTRPLHALTRGARRLEAGERGIRLRVPEGRDEIAGLTEAFNALVAGLERQESWRRAMTADIAHDLRTPLAVLRSEIEGMQDGVLPTDEAALRRLHREVMLLARLVEDLRMLSLSEGGSLTLALQDLELEPVLRRSLEAFGTSATEVGATLRLADVTPGLRAEFDPDRIAQVVGNLLDNALRHAGPVLVEVGADRVAPAATVDGRPLARVWVRDHGPGLPRDATEQVFERFYRADEARSRSQEGAAIGAGGSGLGLAIARAIVEAHGGTITAANHLEGGAVFAFTLPQKP